MIVRKAVLEDLPGLIDLENRCFNYDRIDKRSFRRLITKAHALTLVGELEGRLTSYVVLLFRNNTSICRLYSIAVDPDYRKQGWGDVLVRNSEKEALANGCIVLRLEIRVDNTPSIKLFTGNDYKQFGSYDSYYEDGQSAVRLQKHLRPEFGHPGRKVPYYNQTLDFTCGPAALMMAMSWLDQEYVSSQHEELQIWRESTTIFMTSGHGGCGPHGLALAARNRGFRVRIFLYPNRTLFENSVRDVTKKKVISLVQRDFEEQLESMNVPVTESDFSLEEINDGLKGDEIIVILTSAWFVNGEKTPHWVVITSIDENYVWYHDPYIAEDKDVTAQECMDIPVPRGDFERMCKYGRDGQKAVLILSGS